MISVAFTYAYAEAGYFDIPDADAGRFEVSEFTLLDETPIFCTTGRGNGLRGSHLH